MSAEKSVSVGDCAFYGTSALVCYYFWKNGFGENLSFLEALGKNLLLISPIIAGLGANVAAWAARAYTKDNFFRERTRLSDYGVLSGLEKEVLEEVPPIMNLQGEQRVGGSLEEFLDGSATGRHGGRALFLKYRNPLSLMRAARGFVARGEYDSGFDCLKSAIEWSDGKRPSPGLLSMFGAQCSRLVRGVARNVEVRDVRNYIFGAVEEALIDPGRAWHLSELGRRVADEFNSPLKLEMYIFHALLASAQRRSDEQAAWRDIYGLVRTHGKLAPASDRESRNDVRILDSYFFADSFTFRFYPRKDELVRFCDERNVLADAVPEADWPLPYAIAEDPGRGYVLLLRFIRGELLYDALRRGDKSRMGGALSIVAKIHARYPLDRVKPVDLDGKLRKKLYDPVFGIPRELADALFASREPIIRAVRMMPDVGNTDRHLDQVVLARRIGALDCEVDGSVPCTFDVANMLLYRDFFTERERREYVLGYAADAEKEGLHLDKSKLSCAFHNSGIYRLVCLAGAWSDPGRPSMHGERKPAIVRAIRELRGVRDECPDFYAQYARQYERWESGLERMAALF
ncbi:hypothetical protein HY489_04165 [Candidatus Woesearchaeota archaeon]|nr:hypothetical protein [Candidatus Woesearchaeota archaeon]